LPFLLLITDPVIQFCRMNGGRCWRGKILYPVSFSDELPET
jgi:hypothetical protein